MTPSDPVVLNIICYTDLHGAFVSDDPYDSKYRKVGIDRLITYLNPHRKKGEHILLIDNGDMIQGNYIVDLFDYQDSRFEGLTHPANLVHKALQVDCMVMGNHEFNYGLNHIDQIRRDSRTPWLSANIIDQETGKPYFEPYKIYQFQNFKVAVLALTTEYVPYWEDQYSIAGLQFNNVIETAGEYIPKLKKECDFLIVSYHGGLEKDPVTLKPTRISNPIENQGFQLWDQFNQIDLLLLGHQHRTFIHKPESPYKATLIQGSSKARLWSHTTLEFTGRNPANQKSCELINSITIEPEKSFKKQFESYYKICNNILHQFIGTADKSFIIRNPLQDVWLRKHPFIQWIQNIMCQYTGVDISAVSLLSPNLKGLPESVCTKDILDNYFFGNTICILNITGKTLKKALEKSASFFCYQPSDKKSKKIDIHQDWHIVKIRSYDYDMWHGIDYNLNIGQPIGSRLSQLTYRGKPVQDHDSFRVAVTSYRAAGAFYDMFKVEQMERDFPMKISDLLIADLKEKKHLMVKPLQNFKIT
ncbi:MAG: bifunctional metallophosphatase/5'-nucleotidase [Deltaproteobacteria bacterium]|jgi:2',3'-cyclic-nucleotide 2'-phosphodiesterase / 3'-nucleotidase|nr:bifunctional metallophosphatase/5'-nucleotidase [Deltaproteobacteria bacterium]MBT4525890.1 bifunctional metallophosphatase/5'-nucleotidase [Deltaproteobacteria bacterium]